MNKLNLIPFLVVAAVVMLGASYILLGGVPIRTATPTYMFQIVNTYPHDTEAFTQGLAYDGGFLYESTGLYGSSTLRKVELKTGLNLKSVALPSQYFGEGVAIVDDRIIQLTWRSNKGFVYDKETFTSLVEFRYSTEGWGLTYDGYRLIMSDGSSSLYFLDVKTFERVGQIKVQDVSPVSNLNELEYIKGKVYANVFGENRIAVIDPQTGKVDAWIDLTGLPGPIRVDPDSVLNGIAYDSVYDRLFVTGKMWPELYEIKVLPAG